MNKLKADLLDLKKIAATVTLLVAGHQAVLTNLGVPSKLVAGGLAAVALIGLIASDILGSPLVK